MVSSDVKIKITRNPILVTMRPEGADVEPVKLYIDPGSASAEDLAELFVSLMQLWSLMGGEQKLAFTVPDGTEVAETIGVNPLAIQTPIE